MQRRDLFHVQLLSPMTVDKNGYYLYDVLVFTIVGTEVSLTDYAFAVNYF